MKPHKHAEFIKAWADGAEIECRQIDDGSWFYLKNPTWSEYNEYRIKPNKRKYRVAEMFAPKISSTYTWTIDDDGKFDAASRSPHFVRWLTDWIEYDATNTEAK